MENINIEDRKKICLIGANKVVSSTSNQAIVEINGSNLTITGSDIEVIKLNLENKEIVFSGNISGLKFSKKTEKTGLLKRIFK